ANARALLLRQTPDVTGLTQTQLSQVQNFNLGVTPAVPEPATWAMMIGGFGIVGGAMRRRSAKPTLATA
ncbi:MAG: PEPxxWA-CTERM sorting domain-containing protein, partial [Sphingomonas sp.]|nr:PEPxxWA-CTERM sorting domain-containing protein [Sphingomonas sp.]